MNTLHTTHFTLLTKKQQRMKKVLVNSGIVFDEAAHTYEYEGKKLNGVTPIVSWMYPETYAAVNEETLAKAAERGKWVHEQCQMYNAVGFTSEELEVTAYIRLLNERGLKPIEGEYLISDYKNFASAVDVVFDDYSLGDIKCTSQIHYDCVALQLNIYRVFFEEMNIEAVPRLYVIWLPKKRYGEPEIQEVPLWDRGLVWDILEAYRKRSDPAPLRERIKGEYSPTVIPDGVLSLSRRVKNIEDLICDLKAQKERLLQQTLVAMRRYGVKTWDTGVVRFTRIRPSMRKALDFALLKERYPDIYAECLKETETKEGIRVAVKNSD